MLWGASVVTTTAFFDAATFTFSYIVFDPESRDAVIIDPVLDYDPLSAAISCTSLMRLRDYLEQSELRARLILDTHVHADHMTAAFYAKRLFNIPSAIGENFLSSQAYFARLFGLEDKLNSYEPAYDSLLKHKQIIKAGTLNIKTLLTPGHTPSCASFLIEEALFSGDALFQPELGCGRTDFPGGSAEVLYKSVKTIIYSLPENTKIYVGHDYPQSQDDPRCMTTVGECKRKNIMLDDQLSQEAFVSKRAQKDQSLQPPKLLLPAMQVNILGGQLPHAHQQGQRYLRLPLSLDFGQFVSLLS